MGPLTIMALASAVFFVVGFILTWAIREGGSYHFLLPSRWRKSGPARDDEPGRGPRS